jgi:hypothetical protein
VHKPPTGNNFHDESRRVHKLVIIEDNGQQMDYTDKGVWLNQYNCGYVYSSELYSTIVICAVHSNYYKDYLWKSCRQATEQ